MAYGKPGSTEALPKSASLIPKAEFKKKSNFPAKVNSSLFHFFSTFKFVDKYITSNVNTH